MPSNVLYPSGSENLLKGNFHLCSGSGGYLSGTAAALVSNTYTYSGSQEFFSPSVVGSAVAIEQLSTVTCVTGTLDAADITFSSVTAGSTVRHVILFQSGTAAKDDFLLANFETGSGGTEINIATNGGDITISWNANGILALSGGCA